MPMSVSSYEVDSQESDSTLSSDFSFSSDWSSGYEGFEAPEHPPKRMRALVAELTHGLQGGGDAPPSVDKRTLHLPRYPRWGDLHSDVKVEQWRWGVQCRSYVWQSLIDMWEDLTRTKHTWQHEAFRKEFSVPRQVFDHLVKLVEEEGSRPDTPYKTFVPEKRLGDRRRGPLAEPLRYKVAASLKYLTSRASFNDIAKLAGLSKTCIRVFFHQWIRFLVTDEYHKHVYLPSGEELGRVLKTYENLGFPGCAFSTDGVHIYWGKCPTLWAWLHTCHEKDGPTRVFNASVTHNGIVIFVPPSLPGRNNDKTGAKYHALLHSLNMKKVWHDVPFELYNEQGEKYTVHGLYSITDGGYHQWRCTQSPSKWAGEVWHARQSKRMESVRKDVECVFGKIFSRFRIFRKPLLVQQAQSVDDTFRVCVMLHNMICRFDGLDKIGDCNSDWKGAPLSMDDLNIIIPSLDQLQLEVLDDVDNGPAAYQLGSDQGKVDRDPEWSALREKLILHYKMAWQKKEIKWLKTGAELGLSFRSKYGSWRENDHEHGHESDPSEDHVDADDELDEDDASS